MTENSPEIIELLCEESAGFVIQQALNYPCQQQYKDDLISIGLKHLYDYAKSHDINSKVPFQARLSQVLKLRFYDYFRSIFGRNHKDEDNKHKREFTSLNNLVSENVEVGDLFVDEQINTRQSVDNKLIYELFDILIIESELNDREIFIAHNYLILGCTLRECATELGITESRVSQLYARIEAKFHDTYTRLYGKKSTLKH